MRMKVRCILPQAFNEPSQVHDVSVTWTIDIAHTRNPLVLVDQGSLWNRDARTEFRHYCLKSPERSKYMIPHVINAMGKKCKVQNLLLYIPCNSTHHTHLFQIEWRTKPPCSATFSTNQVLHQSSAALRWFVQTLIFPMLCRVVWGHLGRRCPGNIFWGSGRFPPVKWLGGGFKHFLFSPLVGEDFQFD